MTLYVDHYMPVPDDLTEPVENVEKRERADTWQLGADLAYCTIRVNQCNGQLAEIASLEP